MLLSVIKRSRRQIWCSLVFPLFVRQCSPDATRYCIAASHSYNDWYLDLELKKLQAKVGDGCQ